MIKEQLLHKFRYLAVGEINEIYISVLVRSIFASMVSIFIPIYLLVMQVPLHLIATYYIIKSLFGIPLSFAIQKSMRHFSEPVLMVCSAALFVVFLLSLGSVELTLPALAALAIIIEASELLFWVPFHSLFAHKSHDGKRESEFGVVHGIFSFAPMMSPLIAALIILHLGYGSLFIVASAGLVLSVGPLFLVSRENKEDGEIGMPCLSPKYFFEGLRNESLDVYWIIYMFIALGSITAFGEIVAASAVAGGVIVLAVSRINKKGTQPLLLGIGSILHAPTMVIRGFLSDFASLLGIMVFASAANSILISPFLTRFYNGVRKSGDELAEREFGLRLGRAVCGMLFLLLLMLVPPEQIYIWLLVLLAPTPILMAYFANRKN